MLIILRIILHQTDEEQQWLEKLTGPVKEQAMIKGQDMIQQLKFFAEEALEFRNFLSEQHEAELKQRLAEGTEELLKVSGGLKAGGSWKEDIQNESWDEILKESQKKLFSKANKGAPSTMKELRKALFELKKEYDVIMD